MSKSESTQIIEQLGRIEGKVEEMYEFYSNGKFTVKLVKYLFYVMVAIGSALVMGKNLIK